MEICANCCCQFEEKQSGGGYKRHSLSLISPDEASQCLGTDPFTPNTKRKGKFLCPACFKLLHTATSSVKKVKEFSVRTTSTSYIASKRKYLNLTPSKTPRKTKARRTAPDTSEQAVPEKKTHLVYFKNHQYAKGFRTLLKKSKAAKSAFMSVCKTLVKKEMSSLFRRRKEVVLGQDLTPGNIENFKWNKVIDEVEADCPIMVSIIKASMGHQNKVLTRDNQSTLGTVLGIIAHKRYPRSFQFFQSLNSTHFWRQGIPQSLFQDLNHLGICNSYKTSIRKIDKIKEEYEDNLEDWKRAMESYLKVNEETELDDTLPYLDSSEEEFGNEMDLDLREDDGVQVIGEIANLPVAPCPSGFSVCWDNLGKNTIAKHHSKDHTNEMHLWAMAFMTENRIPTITSPNPSMSTIPAIEIPIEEFLPSDVDFQQLKDRMKVVTKRIVTRYITAFGDQQDQANAHIKHEKWELSTRKSTIRNIGLIEENPSSTNGVIKILERLHKFVPKLEEQKVFPILSWGDALSCERHNDAHNIRVNGATPTDRLEGLEPAVQEFHKRMLLLQDTMTKLFEGATASEKGTLTYLKNVFNHRTVKKDVSHCFNHCHEFIEFVTEGYICLMALEKLGISSLEDDLPLETLTLDELTDGIIEDVWIKPDMNLRTDDKRKGYCVCNDESDVPNAEEPMVACDNLNCKRGEWFHLSCVNLDRLPRKGDTWFCSPHCREVEKTPTDHKFEYVKAVVFDGLGHLARRDCIRENDGPAMISNWKIDMINFHNNHHPKYFILGHRLLAGINGWLPHHLREDLLWNRTVNYRGGAGNNIPLDMANEFLNREIKDRLAPSASSWTTEVLSRHSLMAGGIGDSLERMYQYNVASRTADFHNTGSKRDNTSDIRHMIDILLDENIHRHVGPRKFNSHPDFVHQVTVKSPNVLTTKLVTLAIKLDKRKALVASTAQS